MRTRIAFLAVCFLAVVLSAQNPPLLHLDFSQPETRRGWVSAHDLAPLGGDHQGLVLHITGSDPYCHSPRYNFPKDVPLWLDLKIKSEQGGSGEVFYFQRTPTPEASVGFFVPDGDWTEIRVPLPPLGNGFHIRLDPPGVGGTCWLASATFSPRVLPQGPVWNSLKQQATRPGDPRIRSGATELTHRTDQWGALDISIDGFLMASGHPSLQAGYLADQKSHWFNLSPANSSDLSVTRKGNQLISRLRVMDPHGGQWDLEQHWTALKQGDLKCEISVTTSVDREILFLPLLFLFPGVESFGIHKGQGLLAGLEYLEDEPSSSEADLKGPASQRQVADAVKFTMPLMAIQAHDRYLGVIWEKQKELATVFDSPDRFFNSGGHLMGLIFPGSDGRNRDESSLIPFAPTLLKANQTFKTSAMIVTGQGRTILPAVQRTIQLKGLPPVPKPLTEAQQYLDLAAAGWMRSRIRENNFYRHAFWPGFNAGPAADAAIYLDYLSQYGTSGREDAAALSEKARETAGPNPPFLSGVSHVRHPMNALVLGGTRQSLAQARHYGFGHLQGFEPDGSLLYRKSPTGQDYGKTHFAPDANGLTAQRVMSVLEAAAYTGDPTLVEKGIGLLQALDKFDHTVPRGAQTWEIPLHTPDILASAYLVRAYTLGFELTREPEFLDRAIYWAWTGIPFVYLQNPTEKPIGPYSTIAVLGATGWVAPVWIGQPVQWCGLVYADALYRLAPYDAKGLWKTLADGITAAGVQHTWPHSDEQRQGLLPDFFLLKAQRRDGPAINPGTVMENALRLYNLPPLYDFKSARGTGCLIHAAGQLELKKEKKTEVEFRVQPWSSKPTELLVSRCPRQPKVWFNGKRVPTIDYAEGSLVLKIDGKPATVRLEF